MPTSDHLAKCQQALTSNGFEAFIAADPAEAKDIFFNRILSNLKVTSASWGDSQTMHATGVLKELSTRQDLRLIRTFEPGVEERQLLERRRQALLTDLFLTGSNALTLGGQVVNLDMIGNRIAPLSFGPKKVVIFAGRNKLVADLEQAMERIRTIAAPQNARRHRMPTPCEKTGRCHDCNSPKRICNNWSIIEKCFPPKRIKLVLIDAELGL